jgi:SAM-dependent methyltransferase
MTHEEKVTRWIGRGKFGTEIGAGQSPIPNLVPPPIYVDCFKEFGQQPCHADFYGHATALPFHDNSLDYVASSHVLEHVANPVAALAEWYRVLRPGGIIYLVVPDRRCAWDHARPLTTVEHMLSDFERSTTSCDATHIEDFVFGIDWSQFSPDTPAAEVPARKEEYARGMRHAVSQGAGINIHFHTFEPGNVRELFDRLGSWPARRFNWEVVDFAEPFPAGNPNGLLVVARVNKTWSDRAAADWFHIQHHGDPRAALRADAEPFGESVPKPIARGGVH